MLIAHFLLITSVFHLPWFETLEIPLTSFILHRIQYVKFFYSIIGLASDFSYSFSPPFPNLKHSVRSCICLPIIIKTNLHQLNPVEFCVPPGIQHLEGSSLELVWWLCNANRDLTLFLSLLRYPQQVVFVLLLFTLWPQSECSISSIASMQSRQEEGEGQRVKD